MRPSQDLALKISAGLTNVKSVLKAKTLSGVKPWHTSATLINKQ
jgi:hypothetical protein